MNTQTPDMEKQKRIAEAAFLVFATHGYKGTTMEKIAVQAGMSRPALYLHFQNKEAVFAHLAVQFFQVVAAEVDNILHMSGDPAEVLKRVFDAFDQNGSMEVLLNAEHGDEMLEIKATLAAKQVDDLMTGIRLALTDWLAREVAAGRVACSDPQTAGQTIMSAYYGLKSPPPDYQTYKSRVAALANMLGKGLLPASR